MRPSQPASDSRGARAARTTNAWKFGFWARSLTTRHNSPGWPETFNSESPLHSFLDRRKLYLVNDLTS